MTELTKKVRRTATVARERVVVTLYPGAVIGFRRSRTRREYTLPLMKAYAMAIEAEQARVRAEKAAKRGRKTLVKRGLLAR